MDLPPSEQVFSAHEIGAAIDTLAATLNARCRSSDWIAMCVLNGGLMFTSELMKRLEVNLRLDSIRVSRYHDTTSGKELKWHTYPDGDVAGKRILLLDDIFDEGQTLAALTEWFMEAGAKEVITVVLVEKEHDRKVEGFRPDLVGLTCEDAYVFGFGMDYEGYFRNLPDIHRLIA